ncbi:CARDB protein [Halogranum amylolyticum]|uniref:CARDB protein n=1 Tax=Halogranum amylolyticum TaxID=660520 RepID=A0A1H8N3N9_9EURY|nr:CARDB domain-containing protein [Halogranum amylolyticum]SEO24129.1 CARDB protein [Halogranum amylolyticum]
MIRFLLILVLLLSTTAVVAGVPDVRLTVADVVVEPTTPLVGETVTVTATVQNSGGSASAVDVSRVILRGPDGRLDTAEDVGSLSQGDSVTVPLTARFDDPGVRTLELRVVGTDENRNSVRISRPVPVAVERAAPQLTLDVSDPAVDAESRVQVTLANPAAAPVRNLVVDFDGSFGEAVNGRQVVPFLDAGETTTVNLTAVPTAAGERELAVRVDYTTASGTEATTTLSNVVSVAPYVDDVGLEVRPVRPTESDGTTDVGDLQGLLTGGGAVTDAGSDAETADPDPTLVEVVVTNFGTVPLDDVVVTPETANQTLPRQAVAGLILPGESATALVDLREVRQTESLRVVVDYEAGVRESRAETTYAYRPLVGDVRITDVRLTNEDGTVTLSGNAANVGRGEATGLVVAVVQTDLVEPTYPQRDYFVGTVGGSDFAPFDLTAEVNESATTVPVQVTYQVDGVRYNHVYDLPYEVGDDGRNRSGLRLPALGTALVLLVGVPALLVLAHRSERFAPFERLRR